MKNEIKDTLNEAIATYGFDRFCELQTDILEGRMKEWKDCFKILNGISIDEIKKIYNKM